MRILVIGDLHFPWVLPSFWPSLKSTINKYNPNAFIIGGDMLDTLAVNSHGRPSDAPGANEEFDKAKGCANRLATIIGNKPCWYLLANHEMRVAKMADKVGIPTRCIKTISELLCLPKHWNMAREFEIDGVYYTHFRSSVPGKLSLSMGMPAVQFHMHSKFSLEYFSTPKMVLWQAQGGCWADEKTIAFSYAKDQLTRGITGFLLVDKGNPTLIKC